MTAKAVTERQPDEEAARFAGNERLSVRLATGRVGTVARDAKTSAQKRTTLLR